jgi:type IV secretory pathway TrbD component
MEVLASLALFLLTLAIALASIFRLFLLSTVGLVIWLVITLLIMDVGSGFPLLWSLFTFRAFRPTNHYQRLKSKYLLRS